MKKFLILVLLLALLAGAYLSKPRDPKASFSEYLEQKAALPISWDAAKAKLLPSEVEYNDRFLWIDVKYHNRTIYTNVFSHWLDRAELKAAAQDDLEKAKDKMDHGIDKLAGKS